MRELKTVVGALVVFALSTMWAWAEEHPHRYGIDFQVGGGYHMFGDINDWDPGTQFTGISPDELHLGTQVGLGIFYRHLDNFGWQIGYSRFIMVQKYQISAIGAAGENWAEQTVNGSETYALATWFWKAPIGELSAGVGPGFYTANMDRSVNIYPEGSTTPLNTGTFANAKGQSFGLLGQLGWEVPIKPMVGILLNVGGRLATVDKITYKDIQDVEQTVRLGAGTLTVDFSGIFAKLTLRAYFKPTTHWRTIGTD
ncbi:MAG: hypothetical protein ACK4OO_02175 [bacterium]